MTMNFAVNEKTTDLRYLVNATSFALQDDYFEQFGSMALWVLPWVT